MNNTEKRIGIIGGGPVGLLAALLFEQLGFKVDVFEKRNDPNTSTTQQGRSINIALSERGFNALSLANLDIHLQKFALPMQGRGLHLPSGLYEFQPYGVQSESIWAISRLEVNKQLALAARQKPNIQLHFLHTFESIDFDRKLCYFEQQDQPYAYQYLLACDGAFSHIRNQSSASSPMGIEIEDLGYGYKEIELPALKSNQFALDAHALHIWPRGRFMLIALPNLDGSFTCTLFLPLEGENSFASIDQNQGIQNFFLTHFSDFMDLNPSLNTAWVQNPIGKLHTARVDRWFYKDVLMLGDAAHAIVPFYGQGMNCGFEDVALLYQKLIDGRDEPMSEHLNAFAIERKPDADAIAQLALDNFEEMKSKVADPAFLKKKAFHLALFKAYPDLWIPQYNMVSFTNTPYRNALKNGAIQWELMDRFEDDLMIGKFDRIIEEYRKLRI